MLFNESIHPYKGIESILLYMSFDEVKNILDANSVKYETELWEEAYETIPNPWIVIVVEKKISMFFAKNNKLFKMVFLSGYTGKLPNGICTNMKIEEARARDNNLVFDDWNEDYESQSGYWIEDDIDNKSVMSISIFIKEILDEDKFENCNW